MANSMLETSVCMSLSLERYNELIAAEQHAAVHPSWDLPGEGVLLMFIYNGIPVGMRVATKLTLRHAVVAAATMTLDFPAGRLIEVRDANGCLLGDWHRTVEEHVGWAGDAKFYLAAGAST